MPYGEWRYVVWNLALKPNWHGKNINAIRIKPWHQNVDVDYHIDSIDIRNPADASDSAHITNMTSPGTTAPWNFNTAGTPIATINGYAPVTGQYNVQSLGPNGLPAGGFSGTTYSQVIVRIRANETGTVLWDAAKDNNWWGQLFWDYEGRVVGPQFTASRSVFLREDGTKRPSEISGSLADSTYWAKVHRTVYDRVVMGVAPIHHTVTGNVAEVKIAVTDWDETITLVPIGGAAGNDPSNVFPAGAFPGSGSGMIGSERIKYASFIPAGDFGGSLIFVTRGVDGTAQTAHDAFGDNFIFDKPDLLHSRSGKAGLFISGQGYDAKTGDDGDLIFDSTAPDFMQVLAKGTDVIPVATQVNGIITPSVKKIETSVRTPYEEENATVRVTWNSLVPNSNVHPDAYPQAWGTSGSTDYVVVPPYLNMDHLNLSNPALTGTTLGYSLTARTATNPRHIVPGTTPTALGTVTGDGRENPQVNSDGTKIAWSNSSHIFVTDVNGAHLGTVCDSTTSTDNHNPTWRVDRAAVDQIAWSGMPASSPTSNIVVFMSEVSFGPFSASAPVPITSGPKDEYPTFLQSSLLSIADTLYYIKSKNNRQYISEVQVPTRIYSDISLLSEDWTQTKFYGLKSLRNPQAVPSLVFYSKKTAQGSLGKVLFSQTFQATSIKNSVQISPNYLDCSNPKFSSDNSQIIFKTSNPDGVYIIDADGNNPYSLVKVEGTSANTFDWYESGTLVSDHNGGANTDVSNYNKGFGVANTVDIIFTNGSPYRQHVVSWSLYRMKGT